jgi:hypothetical protein
MELKHANHDTENVVASNLNHVDSFLKIVKIKLGN